MDATRVAARFSMEGRRALVTGGSVSIGRAIVRAFAEAGADVAIQHAPEADAAFGIPEAAQEAAAEVRVLGRRAAIVPADFAVKGEARRSVEAAAAALGGIDVLVVCASIQYRLELGSLTDEQIDRQIRINFLATLELFNASVPAMIERQWGRVLTIGSINQTRPEPVLPVYAALKSAQHNLAINFARQCAPHGVTVNNLSPGLVATERNRFRRNDPQEWERIQASANPTGRAGQPSEIAPAALLLCSEAGSFITGADLQVDGGHHL
jgi:glucose 1-dehydrogenase